MNFTFTHSAIVIAGSKQVWIRLGTSIYAKAIHVCPSHLLFHSALSLLHDVGYPQWEHSGVARGASLSYQIVVSQHFAYSRSIIQSGTLLLRCYCDAARSASSAARVLSGALSLFPFASLLHYTEQHQTSLWYCELSFARIWGRSVATTGWLLHLRISQASK